MTTPTSWVAQEAPLFDISITFDRHRLSAHIYVVAIPRWTCRTLQVCNPLGWCCPRRASCIVFCLFRRNSKTLHQYVDKEFRSICKSMYLPFFLAFVPVQQLWSRSHLGSKWRFKIAGHDSIKYGRPPYSNTVSFSGPGCRASGWVYVGAC